MDTKLLAEKVKEIQMPKEMEMRILASCKENMVVDRNTERKDRTMKKKYSNNGTRKLLVAAASLALCICVTGLTAMAASGQLKGFFKDKIGWNGAIIGETYEQATDEIVVSVGNVQDEVELLVTFLKPEVAPYRELDIIRIENYEIWDSNGTVLAEGEMEESVMMAETVRMTIPLEKIEEGVYTLVITAFSGGAKAEQPLSIYGEWQCEFVK